MSVTGFNRRRRELVALQEADELETILGDLDEMKYQKLRALAKEQGIEEYHKMNTEELREALKGKPSGGDEDGS